VLLLFPSPLLIVLSEEDDFDDFQAAPPSAPPAGNQFFAPAAPVIAPAPAPQPTYTMQPQQAPMQPNLYNNTGVLSPSSTGSAYAAPNYGAGVLSPTSPPPPRTNVTSPGTIKSAPAAPAKSSGGNFDDLWSMSLGTSSKPTGAANSGPAKSMKDLEKEKSTAGIWGSAQPQQGKPPAMGMGMGGASGGFGGAGASSTSSGGFDDLLG
jgi:epsin